MKTWILVANSSEAKILETDNLRVGELELVHKFTHPDSRKKVSELVTDKPGHYIGDSVGYGAFVKNDPKMVEAEHFAIQLAHELKTAFDNHEYKNLLIVAPAHFLQFINKHFHHSHLLEPTHLAKDYTKYTLPDLHESLKEHLFGK